MPKSVLVGWNLLDSKDRLLFSTVAFFGVMLAASDAVVILGIQKALVEYQQSESSEQQLMSLLKGYAIFLGAVLLAKNIASIVFHYYKNTFLHGLQKKISCRVFWEVISPNNQYMKKLDDGKKISYSIMEPLQVVLNVFTPFINAISEMATMLFVIGILLYSHSIKTLAVIGILGTIVGGYSYFSKVWIERSGVRRKKADALRSEWVSSILKDCLQVVSLGVERKIIDKFSSPTLESSTMIRNKAFATDIAKNVIELSVLVAFACIAVIALLTEDSGFVVFLGVFGFAAYRLMPSLNRLLVCFQSMRYGLGSVQEIASILEASSEQIVEGLLEEGASIEKIDVEIDKLVGRDSHVLIQNKKIKLVRGNLIVLKGPSGIGKSSLVEVMLMGAAGLKIRLDGTEVPGLLSVPGLAVSCGQVPIVFPTDFFQNVSVSDRYNASIKDKLVEMLFGGDSQTLTQRLLAGDPQGSGSGVLSWNSMSGGQRTRINLIRCLSADRDVIFLDEPTGGLDPELSICLAKFLNEYKAGKIIFVVTHDSYFDEFANQLINLS